MSDSNNKSASMQMWTDAIGRLLERIEDTRKRVGNEYPHWADPETGTWTTTVDGDWTGGFWPECTGSPQSIPGRTTIARRRLPRRKA